MAGHNKWSKVKRIKGAIEAKRGKLFSKLAKEIAVAVKLGGPDPDANVRLRSAVTLARAQNMPNDNIERAIKRGCGDTGEAALEEVMYEGYASDGVALLIEAATDNRNRTAGEIRHVFSKNGGSMGEAGCVAWMFDKRGLIVFERDQVDEDEILEVALEAGADDVVTTEDQFEVHTDPAAFEAVKQTFDDREIGYTMAEITMVAQNNVKIDNEPQAAQLLKLMEAIEDSDDVQRVYANFDIPDEILQRIG